MKMKVRIAKKPNLSYQCHGKLKAEGGNVKPPFCFRPRAEGKGSAKKTVVEIHSRVTGKQIGYFGGRAKPFVKEKSEAQTWDYLNGSMVYTEFMWFVRDADRKTLNQWNKAEIEGLRTMTREARKLK